MNFEVEPMNKIMDSSTFHSCKQCKKLFYIWNVNMWVYKIEHKHSNFDYFCSWRCLRSYEKKHQIV